MLHFHSNHIIRKYGFSGYVRCCLNKGVDTCPAHSFFVQFCYRTGQEFVETKDSRLCTGKIRQQKTVQRIWISAAWGESQLSWSGKRYRDEFHSMTCKLLTLRRNWSKEHKQVSPKPLENQKLSTISITVCVRVDRLVCGVRFPIRMVFSIWRGRTCTRDEEAQKMIEWFELTEEY